MTKRELRQALPRIPLGVNANRLPIAINLTGDTLAAIQHDTGIHPSTISQIKKGVREATADQKLALAKRYGTTVAVLFPEVRSEVA